MSVLDARPGANANWLYRRWRYLHAGPVNVTVTEVKSSSTPLHASGKREYQSRALLMYRRNSYRDAALSIASQHECVTLGAGGNGTV